MAERKKKLLIIVPSLGIGGQEKIAVDTALRLKDIFDVRMITFNALNGSKVYEPPCQIECLDIPASGNNFNKLLSQIKRASKLRRIRKEFKPDYVYSFGSTANLTNVLSKSFGRAIVAVHHGLGNSKANRLDRFTFRKADAVIAISKAMKAGLERLYPDVKNITTIENGYDIARIMELSKEPVETLSGSPRFITVGRHEKVKGYSRLINAFSKVVTILPEAELYMVGQGSLTPSLKQQVNDLGIDNCVHFLGYQANPFKYMKASDVSILSSYSEGLPNAVIESLACGLCLIATDCGASEILSDKPCVVQGVKYDDYGVLVENGDDSVVEMILAEAMIGLCGDKCLINKYKSSSFKRAEGYSVEAYTVKLTTLFGSLEK
jgi:glycosyltransferase involved in cell wall biosynthesis